MILDVFYDHFLAAGWSHYHPTPLADYTANVYALIKSYEDILPEELKRMLPYMIQGNWLLNYANTEDIHRALSGMARRTPYESKMEEARTDLIENYEAFEKEFQEFFPEVVNFAGRYVKSG